MVVKYGSERYELQAGARIRCLVCHKTWSYTLGVNGYWKISKFTEHINISHKLGTSVMLSVMMALSLVTKLENGSKKKFSGSDSEDASESDDDLLVGNAVSNNDGKRRKKTVVEVEEQVKKTAKGNKSDNGFSKNGSKKKSGDSDSEDSLTMIY
ncbi:hypothetical protein OUZ56_003220 [Daphnia magna]|uniref:Uncharacterized protein n=1 Tax=Daphnia magna TaxID=35525 RepID=A0ABR0A849_9CRUS|nr:hypothetical protein OUZ56_003220 [Daphnia magna]